MTASAKAKAKAAEKARHKGLTLGAPAADGSAKPASADGTDEGAASAATPPADDAKSADDKNKAIADMLGNTYDTKTGLLKRSKLQRMQYSSRALHHYALGAPPHTDATRDARHMRKHPKGKGKASGGKEAEPKETNDAADPGFTPDPTQPAAAPASKATRPQPTKTPVPKPTKTPKPLAPKPVKASPAKPKAKVDKEEAARIKEEKLRAGGEHTERTAKPPKDKKAPKAPKPDPTQPLTGQD